MSTENYDLLADICRRDVQVLKEKGKHYGNSWRKRGGVGAYMMLARKWDRIENMVQDRNWDVFACERDGVLEDIADLRRYLLLVEGHMIERATKGVEDIPKALRPAPLTAHHGNMMAPPARTHPCTGRCTTSTGDYMCKGCGRTVEEIRGWNTYSKEQKKYLMEEVLPTRLLPTGGSSSD